MNNVPMLITKNLELDMTWFGDVFFNKNRTIAKCRRSLANGAFHLFFKAFLVVDNAHTLSTTTGTGFYKYRITNLSGHFFCVLDVRDRLRSARDQRYIKFCNGSLRSKFTSH